MQQWPGRPKPRSNSSRNEEDYSHHRKRRSRSRGRESTDRRSRDRYDSSDRRKIDDKDHDRKPRNDTRKRKSADKEMKNELSTPCGGMDISPTNSDLVNYSKEIRHSDSDKANDSEDTQCKSYNRRNRKRAHSESSSNDGNMPEQYRSSNFTKLVDKKCKS